MSAESTEFELMRIIFSLVMERKFFSSFFVNFFRPPEMGHLFFLLFFRHIGANIARRGRLVTSKLSQQNKFRPSLADVKCFLEQDDSPRAVFLNSPHNPTGGVTTEERRR
ncbi:MAG: hypothetical protein CM15mP125_0680 [Gammaproteobacteria bacterium]|nr:MAG: hypothetical protein CM15mP125_0680 [Gammaproteobacteria bacterium]